MTKIEWTQETWNPVVGCAKVSDGCKYCYAERMACRLAGKERSYFDDVETYAPAGSTFGYKYANVIKNGKWNGEIIYDEQALDKPLHWKKSREIFVCSMGDLFHKDVPFGFIADIYEVTAKAPQHIYQVLTKRPDRAKEFYKDRVFNTPRNLWLGTSVENQKTADERIPILLQIPAAVRFVSLEPLLGKVRLNRIITSESTLDALKGKSKYAVDGNTPYYGHFIDWAIIGCETNSPKERRVNYNENAIAIVEQCQDAGVPVFVKSAVVNGRVTKKIEEFPPELRLRQKPERIKE